MGEPFSVETDLEAPICAGLYVTFLRCDNETGTKRPQAWRWFARFARRAPEGGD